MITELSKEIINKLINDSQESYMVLAPIKPKSEAKDIDVRYTSLKKREIFISAKKYNIKCSCDESKGEIHTNNKPKCKFCGTAVTSYRHNSGRLFKKVILVDNKFMKEITASYKEGNGNRSRNSYGSGKFYLDYHDENRVQIIKPESRYRILRTYYVREKLNGDIGIDIVRISINLYVNEKGEILTEEKYDKFAEIVPGKSVKAYKVTKTKGTEEIDFFDAFHITSDNVSIDENIYFEGASSMIDFIANCEEFAKRTGFIELLRHYKGSIPENSLFLLYMYLYSEYPVIELLVKMGYYGLIFGLIDKICNNYRRESIKRSVSELSNLLNETTKGSASLTIPTYIGQFLNAKNANIDEYMAWAALNEYSPISKENFEKTIQSEAYLYINYYDQLKNLPNIIKYGYTLNQCLKYIMNQYFSLTYDKLELNNQKDGISGGSKICQIIMNWKDYLEHCELMDIEPDKFPKDIKKAHDDIIVAYKAVENRITDEKLKAIANLYKDYKTTSKYLDVVMPTSVYDFVKEGNDQHNCVGGYASRVANGNCRIFFIRRKDDISKSYITAECTKKGLGQLFYRNNTPVTDYTEREYAKAFCKYILSKKWEP